MSDPTPAPPRTTYSAGDRFLIFAECGSRYAIPALLVQEALLLPKLTALEETPPWVVGAFERLGALVPVISPALALHHQQTPAAGVSDLGIITDRSGYLVALHADEVVGLVPAQRVLPLPPDRLEELRGANAPSPCTVQEPESEPETIAATPIIQNEIALEDGMVPVLEADALRLHAASAAEVTDLPEQRLQTFERALGDADKARLAARALDYSRSSVAKQQRSLDGFVVVEIAGERFAFPAAESLELVRIGGLFPVPGAPAHVLGFSALRGEVITLVDVRAPLGLSTGGLWEPPMMIVLQFRDQHTGIAIDSAIALIRAELGPIGELPVTLRHSAAPWLRGCIHPPQGLAGTADATASESASHPLAVIHLAALLGGGGLVVDQGP